MVPDEDERREVDGVLPYYSPVPPADRPRRQSPPWVSAGGHVAGLAWWLLVAIILFAIASCLVSAVLLLFQRMLGGGGGWAAP